MAFLVRSSRRIGFLRSSGVVVLLLSSAATRWGQLGCMMVALDMVGSVDGVFSLLRCGGRCR